MVRIKDGNYIAIFHDRMLDLCRLYKQIGGNIMKRDLVDELYKTAYKRYREKYPNKDFASIPNFLDSLWFSIEGELNRNGYDAARKYVEEADLIVLK